MAQSYGFVETQGLIGSIEAADAMLKAARVKLVQKREIGFGLVTVIVEGELGAVQSAIDAGKAAAEKIGQFLTCHVIARPFKDTDLLVMQRLDIKPLPEPAIEKSRKDVPLKPTVKKKQKTKNKKKSESKPVSPENIEEKIITLLEKNKGGLTLEQLAKALNKDVKQTRIQLKQLIDLQKIEKVQQRYYLL